MEVLQAFGADEELTEIRRQGGAVIETGVMTPISEDTLPIIRRFHQTLKDFWKIK